jgi:Pregnancy-associated plasma protein-A
VPSNYLYIDLPEYDYKTALRREGADTLNIYMCNLLGSQDTWGTAWFPDELATYPEYDGVIVTNPWPEGATALDVYMTVVHETGHWMGLDHTFYGGCKSPGDGVKG